MHPLYDWMFKVKDGNNRVITRRMGLLSGGTVLAREYWETMQRPWEGYFIDQLNYEPSSPEEVR